MHPQDVILLRNIIGSCSETSLPHGVAIDAVGGRQLNENLEGLRNSLEKAKPDVLAVFFRRHDWELRAADAEIIKAAKSTGTETLVVIPTYDLSPFNHPPFEWL